jgi:hypothetical protein
MSVVHTIRRIWSLMGMNDDERTLVDERYWTNVSGWTSMDRRMWININGQKGPDEWNQTDVDRHRMEADNNERQL